MGALDRAGLLAELATELARTPSETATASAITEHACVLAPEADAVSLTLRVRRSRYATLACTDALALPLDELQYALGEGPCVEAAAGHDWHRSGSIGTDDRWPLWGPRAAALGAESLLSVGLATSDATFGALNSTPAPRTPSPTGTEWTSRSSSPRTRRSPSPPRASSRGWRRP